MSKPFNKSSLAILIGALFLGLIAESVSVQAAEISPLLDSLLQVDSSPDTPIDIIVVLQHEPITTRPKPLLGNSRGILIRSTIQSLQANRPSRRHANVVRELTSYSLRPVREHWILPALSLQVPRSMVRQIAERKDILAVIPDMPLAFEEPVERLSAPSLSAGVPSATAMMNIPAVWQLGITGKGRLVCSFDTGVEQGHPALSAKWRGNHTSLAAGWFSPIRPDTLPFDKAGHGTHTMGVMVGSVGADTIGVAPDAEWITAGVIDQGRSLSTTVSDILAAFQWSLNPDGDANTTDDVPDVILNSWGIPAGLFPPCDQTFWEVIDAVEQAGIVTIFACGNEGPNPQTLRNPADRATGPLNSFSVGAVDLSGLVAGFSSRGPSSCDINQIKPEVVAPGVSIRSSTKGGVYATMSGTSMAAPFVAGLVALCREYNPDATVDEIKQAMLAATTDLGPAGEDNAYGNGLIDAARVIQNLPAPIPPDYQVLDAMPVSDMYLYPGDTCELSLTLGKNRRATSRINGLLTVLPNTPAEVIEGTVSFEFVGTDSIATSAQTVRIAIAEGVLHNAPLHFLLTLTDTLGLTLDIDTLSVRAGIPAPGKIVTHDNGRLALTVSDFGQLGLGPGSLYPVDSAVGLRYDGSENLLYEAGLVVTAGDQSIATSLRDDQAAFRPSDFVPVTALSSAVADANGGTVRQCRFAAEDSSNPPVSIRQETHQFDEAEFADFLLIRLWIRNESLQDLDDVAVALLFDIDLDSRAERAGVLDALQLLYLSDNQGQSVGVQVFEDNVTLGLVSNGLTKRGLTLTDMRQLAWGWSEPVDTLTVQDYMLSVSARQSVLAAGDSMLICVALVAGSDPTSLADHAARAVVKASIPTGTEPEPNQIPDGFAVYQNYPNPFNPSTTIRFALPNSARTRVEIFNLLGQSVRVFDLGMLSAGERTVEWHGDTDGGSPAASGPYFYRVTSGSLQQTRKMLLVK